MKGTLVTQVDICLFPYSMYYCNWYVISICIFQAHFLRECMVGRVSWVSSIHLCPLSPRHKERKKDVCKERGPLCLLYSALPEVPKWFFGDGVLTTMKMLTFVTVNYNKNQYRGFGVLEPLCGGLNLPTKLESLGNNNWTSGIAPASTWELFPFSLLFCQSSWLYYPYSNHGSGTWIIITSQFLIQQKNPFIHVNDYSTGSIICFVDLHLGGVYGYI